MHQRSVHAFVFAIVAAFAFGAGCHPSTAKSKSDAGSIVDSGDVETDAGDSGEFNDAGNQANGCPIDDVRTPIGNCLAECVTCVTNADCDGGACVVDGLGCSSCMPADAGPGRTCSQDGCRTDTDCCSAASTCQGASTGAVCGTCVQTPDQCTTSMDCADGGICVLSPAPACACNPTRMSATCVASCTATSCPPGQQCGTSGTCEAVVCGMNYQCPPFTMCNPLVTGMNPHGCIPENCTTDSNCPVGVCVNGVCASNPGRCVAPTP